MTKKVSRALTQYCESMPHFSHFEMRSKHARAVFIYPDGDSAFTHVPFGSRMSDRSFNNITSRIRGTNDRRPTCVRNYL